jgi:hypothetical protein
VNSGVLSLLKPYANWVVIVLLVAGLFSALIAKDIAFPLFLIAAAICLAVARNWQAIKEFDLWAFDEWVRTRVDAIGVRDWQAPYHAVETYCNPTVVAARNEAAAKMNTIMMELVKDEGRAFGNPTEATGFLRRSETAAGVSAKRHADYDQAQVRFNQCNVALARELVSYLARGHLIAKGLLMQKDMAKSERIIPTSRWRVMGIDIAKAEAHGQGWSYTGVIIGRKPVSAKSAQPSARTKP